MQKVLRCDALQRASKIMALKLRLKDSGQNATLGQMQAEMAEINWAGNESKMDSDRTMPTLLAIYDQFVGESDIYEACMDFIEQFGNDFFMNTYNLEAVMVSLPFRHGKRAYIKDIMVTLHCGLVRGDIPSVGSITIAALRGRGNFETCTNSLFPLMCTQMLNS